MRWNRAVTLGVVTALLNCATAVAASPELSTSNRLQDRRVVTAGQRSYSESFADGRFYANGWHITGEMGGVWAPPLKLVDGVWFGIDDTWVGQATRFVSGQGYIRYELPSVGGLRLERTDFAPDAHRSVLFGLTMTNPGSTKTVTVKVDAHSELMGAYPWGFSGVVPNASGNLPDHGSFDGNALTFTDDGSVGGGAPVHHYAALVASDRRPVSGIAAATGGAFRGPQPGRVCAADDSTSPPSACDDGPFGKGTGGELRYSVTIPAHGSTTLWIAVAGSDQGLGAAQSELAGALSNPAGELREKIATRAALAAYTRVSLPGDRLLQHAIEAAIATWREPDQGIWEVRGPAQHFTSSKLMCWVAVDRGARLALLRGEAAVAERWRSIAAEIHADICKNGLDQRGVFTQAYGKPALDASVLLMPLVRFLPPTDERIKKTVCAIADELTVDGLVLRYRVDQTDDGLSGEEGTFAICSFWLVSALSEIGERQRARHLCEKMLSFASPLGLYAEEIDTRNARHLGNFPQAFTHLALINAVMHVIRSDEGVESQRFAPARALMA